MPLTIPPGLTFADLALELAPNGGLKFLRGPLARIAALNARPAVTEDDTMALIVEFYVAHREAGGAPDPACETIVALLNARGA